MPTPPLGIRVLLGLAAAAVEEVRKLPATLPSTLTRLPVQAVSTGMQTSMRVNQQVTALATRGDEVLSLLRRPSAEPPPWASFDSDDEPAAGEQGYGDPHDDSDRDMTVETTPGRPLAAFDRVPADLAEHGWSTEDDLEFELDAVPEPPVQALIDPEPTGSGLGGEPALAAEVEDLAIPAAVQLMTGRSGPPRRKPAAKSSPRKDGAVKAAAVKSAAAHSASGKSVAGKSVAGKSSAGNTIAAKSTAGKAQRTSGDPVAANPITDFAGPHDLGAELADLTGGAGPAVPQPPVGPVTEG